MFSNSSSNFYNKTYNNIISGDKIMYTKQISDYIDSQKDNMLRDISRLVNIPSTKGTPTDDCPFGEMPAKALAEALSICEESGLSTVNVHNAIGFADINNKPLELGILAHVDVVPEGDGWESNPYHMEYKNGNIIGRGTSDDKGAAVAAIYAIKAIKALGIELKTNVRIIIGSDEECGSADLPHYFENYETPKYSFSPDAEFPLINIEKGRFAPHFETEINNENNIIYFDSGIAVNAVPHIAVMKLKNISNDILYAACVKTESVTGIKFELSYDNDTTTITAYGKAAHASTPLMGNNALTAMLTLVTELGINSDVGNIMMSLSKLFPHSDANGNAMGVARKDDVSGELTMSLDILKFDGNKIFGSIDCRMPVSATEENTAMPTVANLQKIGFNVSSSDIVPPHHVDENLPFIKTLLSSYEKHTGLKGYCMAIGGGTYVHDIENGVAFGCIMPDVDTHMHGANEFMPFEDLVTSAKIFADAIIEICGVE